MLYQCHNLTGSHAVRSFKRMKCHSLFRGSLKQLVGVPVFEYSHTHKEILSKQQSVYVKTSRHGHYYPNHIRPTQRERVRVSVCVCVCVCVSGVPAQGNVIRMKRCVCITVCLA